MPNTSIRKKLIFWNVQRLFDPAGLPVGRSLSNEREELKIEQYKRRISNLAGCLRSMTGGEPPAVLGLAEVESVRILKDLREKCGWDHMVIVDEQLPPHLDGLDVALLLDGSIFEPNSIRSTSLALDNRFATRDLLDVRVTTKTGKHEVVFIVVHWPSRIISEGEVLRFSYSVYLHRRLVGILKFAKHHLVQSDGTVIMPDPNTLRTRWNLPCFIMGDFNDEPYDSSVRNALVSTRFDKLVFQQGRLTGKALEKPDNYLAKKVKLYNPCWRLQFSDDNSVGGTYYRSEWRTYDQLLLSHGSLHPESPIRYVPHSIASIRISDIFDENNNIQTKMQNTTGTPRSYKTETPEGVSDHFPIMAELEFLLDED